MNMDVNVLVSDIRFKEHALYLRKKYISCHHSGDALLRLRIVTVVVRQHTLAIGSQRVDRPVTDNQSNGR